MKTVGEELGQCGTIISVFLRRLTNSPFITRWLVVIKLEKVSKTYQMGDETIHALSGIDLTVTEGESIAIVGPSGSGKSTLLHIVGGLDSPNSGNIVINGQDLSKASDKELSQYRNQSVGFVFQTFNLHPTYNALENVALPLIFSKIPRPQRLKLAQQALNNLLDI